MSVSDEPSRKRSRTDGDDSLDSEEASAHGHHTTVLGELQRDPDVWLPDGNVIVISQNVAFRVHRSILSLHSEVFRDLFLVGTGATSSNVDPSATMDGCPIVKVFDDPKDLRHLLLVVCCGKNYYHRDDELQPVPFDVLESLVRMGHKYNIPSLLGDALGRLQKYYTNNLSAWENNSGRARYVTTGPCNAVRVIQLARLTNTPSLLPSAFLICCDLLGPMIAELATGNAGSHPSTHCAFGVDDILRIINGKAELTRAGVNRFVVLATAVPTKGCRNPDGCALTAHKALSAREDDFSRGGLMQNSKLAFVSLQTWFWFCGPGSGLRQFKDMLCSECVAASKRKDAETRLASWRQLPATFNLKVDSGWA